MAHLATVIDCDDREVVGFEFSPRGGGKEAKRAIEEACLRRFGTLRPSGRNPPFRPDNGLISQSRRFRAASRDRRLRQHFIGPYAPEQIGLSERFFRTLKEGCVSKHDLKSFAETKRQVLARIHWYNSRRSHSALGFRRLPEFHAQQLNLEV